MVDTRAGSQNIILLKAADAGIRPLYINYLVSTMPQRLEDCKKLKGNKTAW